LVTGAPEGDRKVTLPATHRIVLSTDLPELTGFEESQLKEMVKDGKFPQPLRLGQRKLGWLLDEIIAGQQEKIAERDSGLSKHCAAIPQRDSATKRWKPNGGGENKAA
jgi:prophage regulatory protein